MKVQVVVPSKGRSGSIMENSLALFPDALVSVEESEMDAYQRVMPRQQLVPHPALSNLPAIRNWLFDHLEHFDDDPLVIVDDDVRRATCYVGWRPRTYRDPVVIAELLESTAQCAADAGAMMFGFSLNPSPKFFDPQRMLRLNSGIGQVHGFLPGHGLRYDPRTHLLEDMDITLQSLLKHRIVWSDQRWFFQTERFQTGGSDTQGGLRREKFDTTLAYMRQKWGQYVSEMGGENNATPRVSRRQGAMTG